MTTEPQQPQVKDAAVPETGDRRDSAAPADAAETVDTPPDQMADALIDEISLAGELIEVFATDNDITVSVAVDEVLRPGGVAAAVHERRSRALPAPAAEMGTVAIAVPAAQAENARALLRDALRDGVLLDGRVSEDSAIA